MGVFVHASVKHLYFAGQHMICGCRETLDGNNMDGRISGDETVNDNSVDISSNQFCNQKPAFFLKIEDNHGDRWSKIKKIIFSKQWF